MDGPSDRVSIAFKKFDLDNDGYLSWEEFTQVQLRNETEFELKWQDIIY